MSEKSTNSYEGYTGKLIEEEIFGRCGGPWDHETFFSFAKGVQYAKENQPENWRPSDPEPLYAGNLFSIVAETLGLNDWSELKLYSAVGTPLDIFHSVDAFFEYHGGIVTLDITLNPQKDVYKADYVINPETTDLNAVADGIAKWLNKRAKAEAAA